MIESKRRTCKYRCNTEKVMDFLNQIWTAWNAEWGVTVATILSIIAIAMNAGDKMQRLIKAIVHWKAWPAIRRRCGLVQRKCRIPRAKRAMIAMLSETDVWIPMQIYDNCLTECFRTSTRDELKEISPQSPTWLNDYYVATALERLYCERKIARGRLYWQNGFPPSPELYLFQSLKTGKTAAEQTDEIETESKCKVHQTFSSVLRETAVREIGLRRNRCTG